MKPITLTITNPRRFGKTLRAFEPAEGTYTDNIHERSEDRDEFEIRNLIAADLARRFGVDCDVTIYHSSGLAIGALVPDTGSFLAVKK